MSQSVLRIDGLPSGALDAAAAFHRDWAGKAGDALAASDALCLVLPSAPYDHDDWRRAAARDLARLHAPKRVNILAGDDETAIAATVEYLAGAPGVTGQLLLVSGHAGEPAAL